MKQAGKKKKKKKISKSFSYTKPETQGKHSQNNKTNTYQERTKHPILQAKSATTEQHPENHSQGPLNITSFFFTAVAAALRGTTLRQRNKQ